MAGTSPLRTIGTVSTSTIVNTRVLILGSLTFGEYEHPEELKFGLEQKVVSHDLIGGTRYVQTMGAFGKDVTWSGNLYGSAVKSRIATLNTMLTTGAEQRLKWLLERYDVVVTDFDWTYDDPYRVRYEITVKIVRDVSGKVSQGASSSVQGQATALAANANTNAANIVAVDQSSAAASLQGAVNGLTQQLPTNIAAGSSGSFLALANQAIGTAKAYLGSLGSAFPNSHIFQATQLVQNLTLLAANVAQGQSPRTITVYGGYLPTIAAREYGDPSLAQALATANGLIGNRLPSSTLTTLVLPPLTGSPLG